MKFYLALQSGTEKGALVAQVSLAEMLLLLDAQKSIHRASIQIQPTRLVTNLSTVRENT